MVKKRVQKLKKRRNNAAGMAKTKHEALSQNSGGVSGPVAPEHVRRKVARQSKFMSHIIDSHKLSLSAKTSKLKKKQKRKPILAALADLSSLSGALHDAAHSDVVSAGKRAVPKGLGIGGCKKRTIICDKESERLQQVLAHPQFKLNPIAAVTAHLTATLPPVPPMPRLKPSQTAGSKRRQKQLKERPNMMQMD